MKKIFAVMFAVLFVATSAWATCNGGLCDDPSKAQAGGSLQLNHFDVGAVGVGNPLNGAGSFYVVGGEFNGSYSALAKDWKSGGPWNIHGDINAYASGFTSGEVFTSSADPDPVSGGFAYTGTEPGTEYSGTQMTVTERSRGEAGANAGYSGEAFGGGMRFTSAGIHGDASATTGAGSISTLPGSVAIAGGVNTVNASYWGVDFGFGNAHLDGGSRAHSDTQAHTKVWDEPGYKAAQSYGNTYNRGLAGMNSADVSNVATHGSGAFVAHSNVGGFLGNGYGAGTAGADACFSYGATNPTYVNVNGTAGGNTFTEVYTTGNGVAGYSGSGSHAKTNF
jgi:hypothetical protein